MNRISILFLTMYLATGLVPYFQTADKIVPQNLYLCILNFGIFIYYFKNYKEDFIYTIKKHIRSLPVLFMFLYIFWSTITLFSAINIQESILTIVERYNLFVSFLMIIYIISKIKNFKKYFFYIITILTIINLISVLNPYFGDIISNGKPKFRALYYRGISGNINIMAYILIAQIFIINFYFFGSKIFRKILIFILNLSVFYTIFGVFHTRSAILSVIILNTSILIMSLYLARAKKKSLRKELLQNIFIFILPVLFAITLTNYSSNKFKTINFQDRVSTLSKLNTDTSLSQRLRYYKSALTSISKYPIFGIGIGNWEIESVKYENPYLKDFVVPYHTHNDYLEVAAESGIIGFFFFFGSIFYLFFLLIKNIFFRDKNENTIFLLYMLIALSAYLIDSMFNFPFDRTYQQIYMFTILSVIINYLPIKQYDYNIKYFKPVFLILIFLYPFSLYSSVKFFNASKQHALLLYYFNNNDFSKPTIEEIETYEMDYPNITPTSLSLNTLKGFWYMKNEKPKEAINFFRKGIKNSPHIYLSESGIGFAYASLGRSDSAVFYSKKAFEAAPNNYSFFANYAISLLMTKDSSAIKEAYSKVSDKYKTPTHDLVYVESMREILNEEDYEYAFSDFEIDYVSGNDRLKQSYYSLKLGDVNVANGDYYHKLGLEYFEEEEYEKASENFLKAVSFNKYEFPYKENAANALMKIGKNQEALDLLNELIDDLDYKTPKAHYLRGLILYEFGEIEKACNDFLIADRANLFGSSDLYSILCKN